MRLDPPGTLVTCGLACFFAGVMWAAAAALIVVVGSVRIPPRVPPNRVWVEWRSHRLVWAFAAVAPALGVFLTSGAVWQHLGLADLYWRGRAADLLLICRLGGASGFLAGLLVLVLSARRRASRARRLSSEQESRSPAHK